MKAVIWRVATGAVLAVVAAAATAADPIDVVIPAPVDGVVTEYTLFDFAAVSIWRTNAQKQDVQPALVEGQVITKIGGSSAPFTLIRRDVYFDPPFSGRSDTSLIRHLSPITQPSKRA